MKPDGAVGVASASLNNNNLRQSLVVLKLVHKISNTVLNNSNTSKAFVYESTKFAGQIESIRVLTYEDCDTKVTIIVKLKRSSQIRPRHLHQGRSVKEVRHEKKSLMM